MLIKLPGGIVVDDIRDMHLTIDAMLGNDKERARLGKEGKQYAFENCRRRTAVKKMESIIHKVLQQQVKSGKSSVSCPLKPSDSAPLKHSTMPP